MYCVYFHSIKTILEIESNNFKLIYGDSPLHNKYIQIKQEKIGTWLWELKNKHVKTFVVFDVRMYPF